MSKRLKVAIVCDWLTGIGGAERVVLAMHELYPKAPIYTSQYTPSKIDWFDGADIRTGWLQKLPSSLKKFLPLLRYMYFSRLDLSDYDLVLSSSGAEAKAIKTGKNTIHICYCHSPTHYYWTRRDEYLKNPGFPRGLNWLAKLGLRTMTGYLKMLDRKASKRPDYMITNSSHTQKMIKRYYRRDSEVVWPPVEIKRFKPDVSAVRAGFVVAGRQTPYKRFDLAIKAANDLKVPLVVIGDGPDHKRLTKMAEKNVIFLTSVSDFDMVKHFESSIGFIMPNMDDFGIVAVEAMAAGTPVIAYKKGGALDYVVEGKTGLFFKKQTPESLADAITEFQNKNFKHDYITNFASQFSVDNFKQKLTTLITQKLDQKEEDK